MRALLTCRVLSFSRALLSTAFSRHSRRLAGALLAVASIAAAAALLILAKQRSEWLWSWEWLQEPLDASDYTRVVKRAKLDRASDGSLLYPSYEAAADQDGVANARRPITAPPRIVCWVMTTPEQLRTRGAAVNSTWLRRCDVGLFMSSAEHPDPAVINIVAKDERWRLPFKTMRAFKYLYDNHFHNGDWFLKADDDTYVIVDNLRKMLSTHDPADAVYFGHRFKAFVQPQGYASGGAGYVLSKQALFRFAEYGYKLPGVCAVDDINEDLVLGECMQNLSVRLLDSRDSSGRLRFHAYRAAEHLASRLMPDYPLYDGYGAQSGLNATSPYAISFHYVTPEEMYLFEYFVYHFRRDGDISASQSVVAVTPGRYGSKPER